jgi:NiFe hydrogenase small subunit HydA
VHFLTFGSLPPVDELGRPKFAYSRLIHENCERRAHFDAGRFVIEFGDEGHRKGYCLYKVGCKGPETYANCPTVLFGDAGAGTWPVGCGCPCIGCTEQGVGFSKPIHMLAKVKERRAPAAVPAHRRRARHRGDAWLGGDPCGRRRCRRRWRGNGRTQSGPFAPGRGSRKSQGGGRKTEV